MNVSRASAIVFTALMLASGLASAQNKITITNADNREIPLRAGSTVSFDAAGNLTAECELTSGVCTALSSGSGTNPNAPTATLTRTGTGAIDAGQSVVLGWTSSGATVCSATTTTGTTPVSTPWNGAKGTSGSNVSVVLATAGSYNLNLQCFNASGGSAVQTVAVTVNEAPQVVDACDLPTNANIQPAGFTRINQTWVQGWSAPNGTAPVYPNGLGVNVPFLIEKGRYKVIDFTPTAGLSVSMVFDTAQSNRDIGYNGARPAQAMFISVSPCAGDFRQIGSATDQWASEKCRFFSYAGTIFYSTVASNTGACVLQAGVKYYMNIIAADPANGITAGEDSCGNTSTGCDIVGKHRPLL